MFWQGVIRGHLRDKNILFIKVYIQNAVCFVVDTSVFFSVIRLSLKFFTLS